jgi:hypothetical protein
MMKAKNAMAMMFAVGAALAHTGAEAASGEAGLNACVSELAKEISKAQGYGVDVRLDEDVRAGKRSLETTTTFFLDARDAANEQVVAKVNCTVDKRAKIRKFVVLPDDAPLAENRIL